MRTRERGVEGVRRVGTAGLTIVELLAVLVILGILGSIGIRSAARTLEVTKVKQASVDILDLQAQMDEYAMSLDSLPSTLAGLGQVTTLDPWGRPYVYARFDTEGNLEEARRDKFLKPLNSTYDLYSMGADGLTEQKIGKEESLDDIIRANDGGYVGLASSF